MADRILVQVAAETAAIQSGLPAARVLEPFGITPRSDPNAQKWGGNTNAFYNGECRAVNTAFLTDHPEYPLSYFYTDVAYAPGSVQASLIRQGWNAASIIAANKPIGYSTGSHSGDCPFLYQTPQGFDTAQFAYVSLVLWAMHFQTIGSDIYVPKTAVYGTNGNKTDQKLIGENTISWADALKITGVTVVPGNSGDYKSVVGNDCYKLSGLIYIEKTSSKSLSSGIVYNYNSGDLSKNWALWGNNESEDTKDFPQTAKHPLPNIGTLPSGSIELTVTTDNVNVRDSGSTSGKVLTKLKKGDTVKQISEMNSNGFSQIQLSDGTIGYASASYLMTSASLPAGSYETSPPQPGQSNVTLYSTGSGVNVRESGSMSGAVIAKLNVNNAVTQLTMPNLAGFIKVQLSNGSTGYVSKDYLSSKPATIMPGGGGGTSTPQTTVTVPDTSNFKPPTDETVPYPTVPGQMPTAEEPKKTSNTLLFLAGGAALLLAASVAVIKLTPKPKYEKIPRSGDNNEDEADE